jgi:hypothetical protein
MTEKRQTSQGKIIRIFITKLSAYQTCLDQNFTQKGKGLLDNHIALFFFMHQTSQNEFNPKIG